MNHIHDHKTASASLIGMLKKYLQMAGISENVLNRLMDISPDLLKSTDSRIPYKKFERIFNELHIITNDADFGLHFGELCNSEMMGGHILSCIMKNCPTVRGAIEKFCRYHSLLANAVQFHIIERKSTMVFRTGPSTGTKVSRHLIESIMCSLLVNAREMSSQSIIPLEVRFSYPAPERILEHQRIFNCPLIYDQPENELIFSKDHLDLPILLASDILLDTLERHAQKLMAQMYLPNTWSEKTSFTLIERMHSGKKLSLTHIASDLMLSERVLQKKLNEEKTNYRNILDQTRKELALNYLVKEDISICDVTFLLGFSDQSAFNHAFKKWLGLTPLEFRNHRLKGRQAWDCHDL